MLLKMASFVLERRAQESKRKQQQQQQQQQLTDDSTPLATCRLFCCPRALAVVMVTNHRAEAKMKELTHS
jgi:hypothetical protein